MTTTRAANRTRRLVQAVLLAAVFLAPADARAAWGLQKAKPVDPKLPRVLLIGDSILNGYRGAVAAGLKGQANVDCWVNPYHVNSGGLHDKLRDVLAQGPYDVIHFNLGLHGWTPGRVPEGKYEPLLRAYVAVLKKGAPKARLIWASTTQMTVKGKPTQLDPEFDPVITKRNRIATDVMRSVGAEVNDLYGLMADKLALAKGDRFHWKAPAYKLQAAAVVVAIKRARPAGDVNSHFAAWKASRPARQQAWETVLEANLGSFYLPIYKKAKLAGKPTAWDYVQDDPALPRVLLIGDSISRGYTRAVRTALAGKANVHRAPANCGPTDMGLKKLDVWLGKGRWDVIHFNFGIHDSGRKGLKPADYGRRLDTITQRLAKTGATLIWASSTPLTLPAPRPAMLEKLNAEAHRVMTARSVAVNDLYAAVKPHLAKYQGKDHVHLNAAGYDVLGNVVAGKIEQTLAARKPPK